jgi:hypothetical protein
MSRDGVNPFMEKLILISAENLAAASTGVLLPQPVHRDIACLAHGQPDKMSGDADIEAMCAAIVMAGKSIFGDRSFDRDRDPVAFWCRNLRHHFAIHRYKLNGVRTVARSVRTALRRFGFPI